MISGSILNPSIDCTIPCWEQQHHCVLQTHDHWGKKTSFLIYTENEVYKCPLQNLLFVSFECCFNIICLQHNTTEMMIFSSDDLWAWKIIHGPTVVTSSRLDWSNSNLVLFLMQRWPGACNRRKIESSSLVVSGVKTAVKNNPDAYKSTSCSPSGIPSW